MLKLFACYGVVLFAIIAALNIKAAKWESDCVASGGVYLTRDVTCIRKDAVIQVKPAAEKR